jgi:hypothetical protein
VERGMGARRQRKRRPKHGTQGDIILSLLIKSKNGCLYFNFYSWNFFIVLVNNDCRRFY